MVKYSHLPGPMHPNSNMLGNRDFPRQSGSRDFFLSNSNEVSLSSAINAVFYLGVEIEKSSEFDIYLGLHDG